MKRNLLKIWSLTMVMVISISTTGLAINKHFCGGKEKAKAIFFEAEKCAFEVKKSCKKHEDTQLDRKACCEDKASFVKQLLNVDLEITTEINDLPVVAFMLPLQDNIEFIFTQIKNEGYVYRPPPIDRDVNILFQTFLL